MEGIRPRIRIKSNDPVARGILEQFYDQCKEKAKKANLTSLESEFVDTIEAAYQDDKEFENEEVESFFKQVYSILEQAEERSKRQEQIFTALSCVIFPGEHRSKTLDTYFDGVRETVTAVKRLDFSVQAPLIGEQGDSHNFLTFSSVSINSILETARYGMLTTNVLNAISNHIENTIFIVTDTKGAVRTINALGKKIFGVNRYEAGRSVISDFLIDAAPILKDLNNDKQVKDWKEVLISSAEQKKRTASLLLLETDHTDSEIKELVFVIKLAQPFDLRLGRNINIIKLKSILQAAQSLESKLGDNPLISDIKKHTWDIREAIQGSMNELMLNAPKGCDHINLANTLQDVMQDIIKGNPQVEIKLSSEISGDFLAVPADIEQIFAILTDIGCLYPGAKYKPSFFGIEIKEAKQLGILISCTIKDLGFGLNENGNIYFTETKEFQTLTFLAEKYFGFIELFPQNESDGIIQLCVPYVKSNYC